MVRVAVPLVWVPIENVTMHLYWALSEEDHPAAGFVFVYVEDVAPEMFSQDLPNTCHW
jgi:hypothetical protein